jgi:hypothetical protein
MRQFSETLEPYVRDRESRPIALGSYTLVEEYTWQRFYRDRQDIRLLKSEFNPYLPPPGLNLPGSSFRASGSSCSPSG